MNKYIKHQTVVSAERKKKNQRGMKEQRVMDKMYCFHGVIREISSIDDLPAKP